MSKLPLTLKPAAPLSKPDPTDPTDRTRATWRAAYGMARRMIRDRATHGTGAAWDWYLRAARRRFTTPAGWRIAQLAGRVVFDQRTPTHGTAGDVDVLLRQGFVRRTRRPRKGNLLGVVPYRCATVDRVRALGLTFAWSADPLASSADKGLRAYRAMKLRQERATRREVVRGLAADRVAIETGVFFTLTDAGRLALAQAEARA